MKFKRFVFAFVMLVCMFTLSACSSSEPKNRTTNNNPQDTVQMTIYAYDGKGESFFGVFNLGHSFLSFKNNGSEQIVIGKYVLSPDEEITISTWCIQDSFGVWYNVESSYIHFHNKYDGRYSITTNINVDKLDKLNKYILSNDEWRPTKNCTNFVTGAWNTVVASEEKLATQTIYTPTKLVRSIKCFKDCKFNNPVALNENLGYFKGSKFVQFKMEEAK